MKKIASIMIIIAGICWGIIGIFSRRLSAGGFNAIQITAIRSMVTGISMTVFLFITDYKKLQIDLKDIWMFLGTGICSIVFFNICYFKTVQEVPLSVAAILLYTAPCFVVIFSAMIFHEKIDIQKITALILAFAGCILTTGILGNQGIELSKQGILFGIGSGFGYSLYSIFGRIALKKYHSFTVTAYTFIIAGLCLLPFCNVNHILLTMYGNENHIILYALSLGFVSTLIPFLCYTKGLEYIEPGKASVMAFIEPMVATVIGIVVFSEPVNMQILSGIFLIFISVILLNIKFTGIPLLHHELK